MLQGIETLLRSAKLRGQREYDQAIELIQDNLSMIDPDLHINAHLEMFRAAQEKGDRKQAHGFALEVERLDPGVPSVTTFLAENK